MELEMIDLGGASKIRLKGRLDTPGVGQIETLFTASVVPPGRNVLVDLTQVTFVSSVGVHLFFATARALGHKNARMVLFGAQPLVKESLNNVRLPDLIPVVDDEGAALALLQPA